jgi:STAM-binding protein
MRQVFLIVYKLDKHPEAKSHHGKHSLSKLNKGLKIAMERAEALTPRVNAQYEQYEKQQAARAARKVSKYKDDYEDDALDGQRDGAEGSALTREKTHIRAEDHRDLAVKLAHTELKRRGKKIQKTPLPTFPNSDRGRITTTDLQGRYAPEKPGMKVKEIDLGDEDLSRRIQATGRILDGSRGRQPHDQGASHKSAFKYPTVPVRNTRVDRTTIGADPINAPPPPPGKYSNDLNSLIPPALPPKQSIQGAGGVYDELPPYDNVEAPPPKPDKLEVTPPSRIEAATPEVKSHDYVFKPNAYLENGTVLRTIFLPSDLRAQFLDIAHPNTMANLETCGVLCGTLISNALFINRLVIPDQHSTSDTCETKDEGSLFDYCDAEDLMVFGWIHTHPSQTCFMSSRDLHTHGSYQVMMAESIAIVCAPSKNPS